MGGPAFRSRLIVGPAVAGWPGLGGAILGQVAGVLIWIALHELAHPEARRGPRIVKGQQPPERGLAEHGCHLAHRHGHTAVLAHSRRRDRPLAADGLARGVAAVSSRRVGEHFPPQVLHGISGTSRRPVGVSSFVKRKMTPLRQGVLRRARAVVVSPMRKRVRGLAQKNLHHLTALFSGLRFRSRREAAALPSAIAIPPGSGIAVALRTRFPGGVTPAPSTG